MGIEPGQVKRRSAGAVVALMASVLAFAFALITEAWEALMVGLAFFDLGARVMWPLLGHETVERRRLALLGYVVGTFVITALAVIVLLAGGVLFLWLVFRNWPGGHPTPGTD